MTNEVPDADQIVIIGGGIVGLCVAYSLRDSDRPVVLFEKQTLGSETTGASIAQFIRYQDTPTQNEAKLRQQAWEWYDSRITEGVLSFEQCGTLQLAASQSKREQLDDLAASHADLGITTELLEAADLTRFGLASDSLKGGLFLPEDGFLDPTEIIQYCATHAREGGVMIETDITVTDVVTAGKRVTAVETTAGTYPAGTVINAAGPWAPEINTMASVSAPIRHTTGPILVLQTEQNHHLPLTFFEDEIYLRGKGTEQLLAGKFATGYEGAKCVDLGSMTGPGESFYLRVGEVVDRFFATPGEFQITNEWQGIRSVTPDGRPIVDETNVANYYIAIGMSGHGVTLAPAIGEAMATMIESNTVPNPIAGLGIDRFRSVE
jgi:sarcosine oxidase subunit beta